MSQIVTVDGAKLLVHAHDGQNVVEAYELALFLEYAQQHLIRKQVLTDWSDDFVEGTHHLLVHDETAIRTYEAEYALRHHQRKLRPMKARRGRVFLLPDGLRLVLERSSKRRAKKLLRSLERKQLVPYATRETPAPRPPTPKTRPVPDAPTPLERRREDYEVLQTLLERLVALEGSPLAFLAIEAAEVMLGRRLEEVRERISARQQPPRPGRESRGPIFGDEGFYNLTQIGRMAGGYSAVAAGRAANIVAGRWGFGPDEIRTRQLWFNELETWEDPKGVERELFRFNREFANLVLDELRANARLKPDETPFPAFATAPPGRAVGDVSQLFDD